MSTEIKFIDIPIARESDIDALTGEEVKMVIKAAIHYAKTGELVQISDRLVNVFYHSIISLVDGAIERKERRSAAASRGASARQALLATPSNASNAKQCSQLPPMLNNARNACYIENRDIENKGKSIEIELSEGGAGAHARTHVGGEFFDSRRAASCQSEVASFFEVKRITAFSAESFWQEMEARGWIDEKGAPLTDWRAYAEECDRRAAKSKKTKFTQPSLQDCYDYAVEKKFSFNVEKFFSHYESNGWKVGKSQMKSWKAAMNKWAIEENERGSIHQPKTDSNAFTNPPHQEETVAIEY